MSSRPVTPTAAPSVEGPSGGEWQVSSLLRRSSSWGYAVVSTILLAVVGIAGSVFSETIGDAFPFVWPWFTIKRESPFIGWPYEGWSWTATVFWCFVLLAGAAFALRQREVDAARRAAQAKTDDAVRQLERLIRTVPSSDFMARFWDIYRLCDEATDESLRERDDETIRAGVRVILRGLALLAREYDGRPDLEGAGYAANIMLYLPKAHIPESEYHAIRERMRFDPVVEPDDLKGVLDLKVELSTTASSEDASPDPNLVALALPIWKRDQVSLPPDYRVRWRVLPGAPVAFLIRQASHFVAAADLIRWCEEHGDFNEEVKARLREYFRPDATPAVGSFIALPILGNDLTAEPIAVVNIHRAERGLLTESESAQELFVPIVQPIQLMLWKLLRALAPGS